MQGGIKKEYRKLHDKPVLVHSLVSFLSTGLFYKTVITLPVKDREEIRELISPYLDMETIRFTDGGETRQESVFNGLREFLDDPPDFILIHDGARPWIQPDLIRRILAATEESGACIPVVEVPDALKEVDENGIIRNTLSRSRIKGAQTPQGFIYQRLYKAHIQAREKEMAALDDAEVYSLLYQPVKAVPGDPLNRKITYQHDIPGSME